MPLVRSNPFNSSVNIFFRKALVTAKDAVTKTAQRALTPLFFSSRPSQVVPSLGEETSPHRDKETPRPMSAPPLENTKLENTNGLNACFDNNGVLKITHRNKVYTPDTCSFKLDNTSIERNKRTEEFIRYEKIYSNNPELKKSNQQLYQENQACFKNKIEDHKKQSVKKSGGFYTIKAFVIMETHFKTIKREKIEHLLEHTLYCTDLQTAEKLLANYKKMLIG